MDRRPFLAYESINLIIRSKSFVNVEKTLTLAETIEPGKNAVLFYDSSRLLEKFLLSYVEAGLRKRQPVIYLGGLNTEDMIKEKMLAHGIDAHSLGKEGLLHITTHDDVFLNKGRFDPLRLHSILFKKAAKIHDRHNGRSIRLVAESNWWLLSDLFEKGLEVEEHFDVAPSYLSSVCTYNIAELIKYVSIYHLARLSELHDSTLLLTKNSLANSTQFYSSLGNCIVQAVEKFDDSVRPRKKHSRFISELLMDLHLKLGTEKMAELEKHVEERLSRTLLRT